MENSPGHWLEWREGSGGRRQVVRQATPAPGSRAWHSCGGVVVPAGSCPLPCPDLRASSPQAAAPMGLLVWIQEYRGRGGPGPSPLLMGTQKPAISLSPGGGVRTPSRTGLRWGRRDLRGLSRQSSRKHPSLSPARGFSNTQANPFPKGMTIGMNPIA